MKKLIITSVLLAAIAAGSVINAQVQQADRLNLPGDNLNLYGVMKLFRESETLEGFEKVLNEENTRINNLDLDGNDYIDYIRVIDNVYNNVHTIVLQVAVSERENQDVAVFTVQRDNQNRVYIQLIGDEALYGKDYIIEPIYDEEQTPNPGYMGNDGPGARRVEVVRVSAVEVAAWPVVHYIYMPAYRPWRSSWYWGYYPSYFRPWRPYYYDYYYGFQYNYYDNYYSHYRRNNYYRYSNWNDVYYVGQRQRSVNVYNRIEQGGYKSTYSRPESRKDGEADYVKMYPSQNRRGSENSQGNTNTTTRRSGSEQSQGIQQENSGNSRRSTENPAVIRSSDTKSTGSSTNRRSETPAAVSSKSSERPAAATRSENTRSTSKSATPAVKSTERRSSSSPAQTAPAKRSGGTEPAKSERRR